MGRWIAFVLLWLLPNIGSALEFITPVAKASFIVSDDFHAYYSHRLSTAADPGEYLSVGIENYSKSKWISFSPSDAQMVARTMKRVLKEDKDKYEFTVSQNIMVSYRDSMNRKRMFIRKESSRGLIEFELDLNDILVFIEYCENAEYVAATWLIDLMKRDAPR